ncbi:MAG: RNB domain-containing ribonuclease, partial [Paracoccaceae bacterium]
MNQLPSKADILQWIQDNPGQGAKRDIARAFGLKGAAKVELKRLLAELADEGTLEKRKRNYRDAETLPPVSMLTVLAPDPSGDLFARAGEWTGTGEPPRILFVPRKGDPALGEGDRILARLTQVTAQDHAYEARLIRKIGANPLKILGVYREGAEGGRIVPVDKGQDKEWRVARENTLSARDGELVEGELTGPRRLGLPQARITARLGDPTGPRAISLIAIHQHGIPDQFSDAAIAEADAAQPASPQGREDLRALPLLTIDPADARDRDDAVYAEADPDPKNPGGHIVWVAIADVAHYVTPGSALDREARQRGNSTYFPDRVVPMLPDVLSGDLCSLHEGVDRACIALRMVLDATGRKVSHRFTRALMRSVASLAYEDVQAAIDGQTDARTAPLLPV